jgi:hypothetical protein
MVGQHANHNRGACVNSSPFWVIFPIWRKICTRLRACRAEKSQIAIPRLSVHIMTITESLSDMQVTPLSGHSHQLPVAILVGLFEQHH